MIKYALTFLLLMAVTTVMAQQKSFIHLIQSSSVQGVKVNGVDVLKVYDATFQQDYSTLRSDSAYFHQKENTFEAFGHVVITQGDTMHIYADKLNYDGNTKIAILTNNVKMVDKDATLTTNLLTYNTATRYGTYVNGGKLVNKDNILTSKNGYYFASTRDAYFRYDVNLLTPDALTLTDTMRYNSGSKIAYFYGPTNIYGKKKGKDNDTLYTENGLYDTNSEQAFFGKKNLYRQNTKTLTGDSLFYDRKKGLGRAINHIIFNDTEQKMTLKGDIGNYYKADQRAVVTKNAYMVILTEQKDTSKKDSLSNQPIVKPDTGKTAVTDSAKKPNVKASAPPNTMPLQQGGVKKPQGKMPQVKSPPAKNVAIVKSDTTAIKPKKGKPLTLSKLPIDTSIHQKPGVVVPKKDTSRIKRDSIFITADTLETRVITYKELKDMQEKLRLSRIKDTTKKVAPPELIKIPVKHIELSAPKWQPDTTFLHRDYFAKFKRDTVKQAPDADAGKKKSKKKADKVDKNKTPDKTDKTKVTDKTPTAPVVPVKKLSKQDSIKRLPKVDSVFLTREIKLEDTARVRILSMFHHVKMFKSDLQGKSDSAFYSSADSTIRLYFNPLVWTQGSQLSGDTINLQMKDKKLNNMEQYPNAFIVNIEKDDSIHFNQVAGKKMRGFFRDDKLSSMYVSGNAETIYFSRDSGKVTNLQRSLSSRIRINFKDNKVTNLTFSAKPEHRIGPIAKFTEEDKVLKGFIWKPKERPVSKESILPSYNKKPDIKAKPPAKVTPPAKGKGKGLKNQLPVKARKDTTSVKPGNIVTPGIKSARDSTIKKDTTLKQVPVKAPDSAKKGKDTSAVKKPAAKPAQ